MKCHWFGIVLVVAFPGLAGAWGPHTEITFAALRVLPNAQRLKEYLGADFDRLAKDYCWIGDWKEAVRPDHYADDYLLFPGMTRHLSHMLPEVRQTYAPYFRRALQAIRTESPREAARWVGSLLHFVQDSGSPPHTTGIGGLLHGKMERWVDESKIDLGGYTPQILGRSDEEALAGFVARMEKLVEFSRARSIELKPIVEKLTERVNQPLELECALETARVTADVLHTLFTLGHFEQQPQGCILEGKIDARPPAGYAAVNAKIMIARSMFATTAEPNGTFRFRNLPAGNVSLRILATGYEVNEISGLTLTPAEPCKVQVQPKPDVVDGNLVRNSQFKLRWLRPDRPDGWMPDPKQSNRWASAVMRIPVDRQCRLHVLFHEGKTAPVAVRWRGNPSDVNDSREGSVVLDASGRTELSPDLRLQSFEKGYLFLEVLITAGKLEDVCRFVGVEMK